LEADAGGLATGAITVHLTNKEKQAIIFGVKIGIPNYGYLKDARMNKDTMALVDTGATCSSISQRFAVNAKLRTFKRTKIHGFDGTSIVPIYIVDILLPSGILFTNVQVAQFKTNLDFDCIIGMDILRKGDMALTNAKDEMVFTFRIPPAETHIDFVEEKSKL